MSRTKINYILLGFIAIFAGLLLLVPQTAFAANDTSTKSKTCKFSDFNNVSWECKDWYMNNLVNNVSSAQFGWAIPTTSKEITSSVKGQNVTRTVHRFKVEQPCYNWPDNNGIVVQDIPYVVCADSFYDNMIKPNGGWFNNGATLNIDNFVDWQLDTDYDDKIAGGDGVSHSKTSVWPQTFDNDMKYQSVVMPITVTLVSSKDPSSTYYRGKNGELENHYMPVLICIPRDASGNMWGENKPNHEYYNQWLIAFIQETTEVTRDNIKTVTAESNGGTFTPGKTNNDTTKMYRYNNNVTESSYSYTTPPTKTTDETKIKTTVEKISRSLWVGAPGNMPSGYTFGLDDNLYQETSYWVKENQTYTKPIKYTTTLPEVTQTKYTPYNLNRNGLAQSGDGDLPSDFITGTSLTATVNNNQGDLSTNNGFNNIQTLNTNADTSFTIKLGANYGMPNVDGGWAYNNNEGYKLDLSKDGVAYAMAGGTYANDMDKMRYWGLNFYASIGGVVPVNGGNAQDGVSSLYNGTDEKVNTDLFTKSYGSTGNDFIGGDYSARFILAGTCTTDNNQKKLSNSKLSNWWINKYTQGKCYEYGTSYTGKITTAGIYNPYSVSHGTPNNELNKLQNGQEFNIKIDATKQQRGIYVGLKQETFEQPVLYGKWEIKTLGVSG